MLPPLALTCFNCHQLAHAAALEDMASKARICEANHDMLGAPRFSGATLLCLLLLDSIASPGNSPTRQSAWGRGANAASSPAPAKHSSVAEAVRPCGGGNCVGPSQAEIPAARVGATEDAPVHKFVTMGVYWSLYG